MIPAAAIREQLQGSPYALISPQSNRRRKDWPLERFQELCEWLIEERDISCLLVGDERTRDLLSGFTFDHPRLFKLAGELSFSGMLDLLPSAVLTVGNDSALGHYAGLHDVPSLILFSAAHSLSTWAPQSGRFICLQAQVPCRLCSFRIEDCDHDYLCMKSITLKIAQAACDQLLEIHHAAA